MHYFLIAGEASGDLHGGALVAALRKADPEAVFTFLGGDCMAREAGEQPLVHYREMAYMGFGEVIRNLGKVRANLRTARRSVVASAPDALILIDYPSFNLKVAETAAKARIPVYYYISPKIWAWKKWRVRTIRRIVRKVFSILPFEPDFYRRNGAEAVYTGNPSVAEVDAALAAVDTREKFLKDNKLRDRPLVALMPGSRRAEIRNNLAVMTEALDRFPQYRGVIIGAPGIDDSLYAECGAKLPVLRVPHAAAVLAHCRAALVTSGTATLETALAGVPQVAVYRGNGWALTYKVMERVLDIPYVTLPNLIADSQVIPELLMHLCTADAVADALGPLLRDPPERQAQLDGYARIREILGTKDSAAETARLLIADLRLLQG